MATEGTPATPTASYRRDSVSAKKTKTNVVRENLEWMTPEQAQERLLAREEMYRGIALQPETIKGRSLGARRAADAHRLAAERVLKAIFEEPVDLVVLLRETRAEVEAADAAVARKAAQKAQKAA